MLEFIFMMLSVGEVHVQERVTTMDDGGCKGIVPFELIQFGGEGVGQDEIIVDELAIRSTGAIRDAPPKGFHGAGQDLADAAAVLQADFVGMDMITEAAGLDDGEEAPTDLGFFLLGEFDRDDTGREGAIQHGPEAFADAGGIDNDVLGMPGLGQSFEFAKDAEVVFADPTVAGNDMISGTLEGSEAGEIDLDDGEGGGITPRVAEAKIGGMEGIEAGFVHAGDVKEERAGERG